VSISEVDIYNLALTNAKSKAFVQLPTENSLERKYCTANFKPSVAATLEQADWKFASKSARLQLTDDVPPSPWLYAYKYPNDCAQFREILRDSDDEELVPYDVQIDEAETGKRILSDKPLAWGRYTVLTYNVNLFSPLFIDAVAWRLAMRIAPPLIGENAPLRFLTQMYTVALSVAETSNKNQSVKRANQTPSLITARG
jgi:hypothetical protein